MKLLTAFIIAAFLSVPAFAQVGCATTGAIVVCDRPTEVTFSKSKHTKLALIPTTWTRVTDKESFISMVSLHIPTGSGIVVSLRDEQTGQQMNILPDINTIPNNVHLIRWSQDDKLGIWCINGFSIKASATGASFYSVFRVRP